MDIFDALAIVYRELAKNESNIISARQFALDTRHLEEQHKLLHKAAASLSGVIMNDSSEAHKMYDQWGN